MELGEAVMFERPDGPALELAVRPRLASWMKAGHPDQVRLATFLDHVESLVSPALTTLPGPLALRLDVGLTQLSICCTNTTWTTTCSR
jgi:hypothetical protein